MDLRDQIRRMHYARPDAPYKTPETAYLAGHRDARNAAAEMARKADDVIAAARAVLEFRIDTPTRGGLRDSNASRAALKALAAAVAAVG